MRIFLLFSLALSFCGELWGVEVKSLYEVELPTQIEGQTFNQTKWIESAFQNVLIRVGGSDKILSVPAIAQALTEVDKYVNQFSYHQRTNGERYLKIIFNENRVNQLFNQIQLPIWEKNRPLTLAWVVIERNEGPHWMGSDSEHALEQKMEKILNERAIPFVFPLLDLTDTSQVSEQMVINGALEPLEQGSKRYHPDIILVGRLFQTSEGWQGQWTLVKAGVKTTWNNTATEVNALLKVAAEDLALQLIGRKGEIAQSNLIFDRKASHRFILTVSGILNGEQYTQVLEYLRHLPGVIQVEVTEVMPEKTTFDIETTSSKESLVRSIDAGRLLIGNPTSEGTGVVEAAGEILIYKVAEDVN